MRFRIKLIRDYKFEIDIDADSTSDAVSKVLRTALHYDQSDQKETKIVAISETPKDVYHSLD